MNNHEAKRRFLSACALDYQTLSGLIEDARDLIGVASEGELRAVVMSTISELLGEDLIEAGFPEGMEYPEVETIDANRLNAELHDFSHRESRDWAFLPWSVDAQSAIDRIDSGWDALGREPDWNEVCWFRATRKGKQAARGEAK